MGLFNNYVTSEGWGGGVWSPGYGHFCYELLRKFKGCGVVIALLLCNGEVFLKYIINCNYLKVELKTYE